MRRVAVLLAGLVFSANAAAAGDRMTELPARNETRKDPLTATTVGQAGDTDASLASGPTRTPSVRRDGQMPTDPPRDQPSPRSSQTSATNPASIRIPPVRRTRPKRARKPAKLKAWLSRF